MVETELCQQLPGQSARGQCRQTHRHHHGHAEPAQREQIRELGPQPVAFPRRLFPLLGQCGTQIGHPAQARIGGTEQTEHTDGAPGLDGLIDQVVDLGPEGSRDVLDDLVAQLVQQTGIARQHETRDRESHHEQRKQRQHSEIRDAGGEVVPALALVAAARAHGVVQPRPRLDHTPHPRLDLVEHLSSRNEQSGLARPTSAVQETHSVVHLREGLAGDLARPLGPRGEDAVEFALIVQILLHFRLQRGHEFDECVGDIALELAISLTLIVFFESHDGRVGE